MKANQKTYVRSLCTAGLIAALYVALTLISAALGLHSGPFSSACPRRSVPCPC